MERLEIAATLLRGCHVAAMLSLFGCLVFQRFVVLRTERSSDPSVRVMTLVSAWLALGFGVLWLFAVSGTIAGADSPISVLVAVQGVAGHTIFGHLVCLRLAIVLVLFWHRIRRTETLALVAGGVALGLQPLLGHAGASGSLVLILVETAHVLAAAAWLGGLTPLLLCVSRAPAPLAAQLCERFTPVGLVAVGTIAVTALPQAGELIGGIPGLFGTRYGHFALLKVGLFFAALGLACVNRLVLTARLATGLARRSLLASIALEGAAGICVVFAAAAMASTMPAVHAQPVWPFPWRPSLSPWTDPDPQKALTRLLVSGSAGLVLIGISLAASRFRILALCVALALVARFVPAAELLLVVAYPTSYARSPGGFSEEAIVHGQKLFQLNCAVCHDPLNGSGALADLTAPHVWGHLDGELFWWIKNGVADPNGAALMPTFGSILSDDDVWALIDFIRAQSIGVQAATTRRWSPPIAAPDTPLRCANSGAGSLADFRDRILRIVAGDGPVSSLLGADVLTIRLVRGRGAAPAPYTCVTASPTAWDAWALLAGVPAAEFTGYQAIVDATGWLRAWLPYDATSEQILAALRDARDNAIAPGNAPVASHRH